MSLWIIGAILIVSGFAMAILEVILKANKVRKQSNDDLMREWLKDDR